MTFEPQKQIEYLTHKVFKIREEIARKSRSIESMIEFSNIHVSFSPERTNNHDETSMQIANML